MALHKPRRGRKETERDFLLLLWTDNPQHQVILEWLQQFPPAERQVRVRDLLYAGITGQNGSSPAHPSRSSHSQAQDSSAHPSTADTGSVPDPTLAHQERRPRAGQEPSADTNAVLAVGD
jgi:hypothetical protein